MGCGGAQAVARPTTVTVAPAVPTVTQPPAVSKRRFAQVAEYTAPPGTQAIALEGDRVLVNAKEQLHVLPAAAPSGTPAGKLVPVGDRMFDVVTGRVYFPKLPPGDRCEAEAFSIDGARASAYCTSQKGEDAVYVFDTKTDAVLGTFKEFQTAAPIRVGTITESGNFIFWVARANGAFEEIKSHVTGPVVSSHSVMSPDERRLFTTQDRNWYTDDRSPASVLDPKTGRTLFTLPPDVDTVTFSPSGALFVAHHSKRWGDMMNAPDKDTTTFTLHEGGAEVIATVPGDDAILAAFSRDDARLAVRYASGMIRVFALR